MNQETKTCQNCKKDFTIEPEDFNFYQKIQVPPPTFCPECRIIRRFVFRNEHHLFRRKDEAEGREIFSGYPPQAKVKVYELDYWWGDLWDPMKYGRDYDFSRPFFEQFRELLYSVPLPAKSVLRMVNSDYSDQAGGFKNCYLCFGGNYMEDSAYTVQSSHSNNCFDTYEVRHSELCYNNVMTDECYRVFFSLDCENCTDVWFSKDLMGCTDCFGCVGLRNKSNHIFNQPYSKEEYKKKIQEFNPDSYKSIQELKQRAHNFWLKFPVKYYHGVQNVNFSGEHIHESKNVHHSYVIHVGEDLKYCQMLYLRPKDSYDHTVWGDSSNRIYECVTVGEQVSDMKFCYECWPGSQRVEYSVSCRSSRDLFGCVSLKKKQHCILNKQYSEEEYFKLRDKIIKHMNENPYKDSRGRIYKYGEFFPSEFSPFAYNETLAQDFFPLTKSQAEEKGYLWREPDRREYETTLDSKDLPDNIKDVSDDILKEIIKCASCGRAYRIIQMELAFLLRIGLPLPRLCHTCRFSERFKFVNPPRFWRRKCQCAGIQDDRGIYKNTISHLPHEKNQHCPNEFKTSYSPDRPEIVYCEQCYQAEVV